MLAFVREGKTNAEIAVRLGISPDGVKYHVSNMLGKLGLSSREQLARWRPRPGDRARGRRWLFVPVPGAVLVGAAGVAAVTVAVLAVVLLIAREDDNGELVAIPADVGFEDGVYCVPEQYFCVVEPLDGGDLIALSTLTAHPVFRERGCQVRWRRATDENHLWQFVPIGDVGAFREPCGGATFFRDGMKVFGPSERSLDRHPVITGDDGVLYVDTSTYLPGQPVPTTVSICNGRPSLADTCGDP